MVEFKEIKLDGVTIPYCTNEEGVDYYPIKYVVEQFLLKGYGQIHKKENLKEFVKRYVIDFTFKGTVPQECYCMNREGWIEYVSTMKKNKNKSDEKIKRLKIFYEFLDMEYKDETVKEYDVYTLRCIENFKLSNPEIKDKQCVKCERYFPNSEYFYPLTYQGDIANTCRSCKDMYWKNDNKEEKYVYETYGLIGFEKYKDDRISFIFKNPNKDFIIQSDDRKSEVLSIIKDMHKKGYISSENLNVDYIKSNSGIKFKIGDQNISIKNNELIEYCSEGDCKLRPWLYPKYRLGIIDLKEGVKIFKRYLDENNVDIEDKFNHSGWDRLLRAARLSQFNSNILGFVVELYDRRYGGYTFHISSTNYYKDKNNCIFDMKYFIEKDLKIPIEKIPLYVTKYALHEKSNALYRVITKDKKLRPYDTLFDWINDCYPNRFIEADFDINPYRSKFDSLEEAQVDEQLRLRFNNVIYNPRDKEYKVEIMGMIPDWIIITEKGCYLTEYYGMYTEGDVSSSHRLQRYQEKTAIKLDKYKSLENNGYKHLAIFPNDIRNNFEGLHKKIDKINNK